MNLSRFPRRRYTHGRTPIEKLDRLSAELGGPTIYIKRDDLLGLAGGGNKTRKLEFLIADALAEGADTVITCGAVQSNHCRLTLAAAAKEGLKCHFVLEERVEGSYDHNSSGNNFLFRLLGVEGVKVVSGGTDMPGEMATLKAELEAKGRKPYVIPGGGSNALGALGYVSCAQETLSQMFEDGLPIDRVVTASGSSGTHAGLVTGYESAQSGLPVVGINVSRPKDTQEALVYSLVEKTTALLELPVPITRDKVVCFDEYVGPGYSVPTAEMAEAVRMFARIEGILLDPVYSGKAAAGLIDLARKGYFGADEKILFVHTGGAVSLFAYENVVLD